MSLSTSPLSHSPTPRSGAAAPSPRQRSSLSPRPNSTVNNNHSPGPTFDSDLLRAYVKKLLQAMLDGMVWPNAKEREKTKEWCREAGEKVKRRMLGALIVNCSFVVFETCTDCCELEIQPKGLYVLSRNGPNFRLSHI